MNFHKQAADKPMYFRYDFENFVFRTEPKDDSIRYFMKFPKDQEYETDPAANNTLVEAILSAKEISREEYQKF